MSKESHEIEGTLFSEEISDSINAVNDDYRQSILGILLKSGSLSFTEILDSMQSKISKQNLAHHLKILLRSGLITQIYSFSDKTNFKSLYELSIQGKEFIIYLQNFDVLTNYNQL